MAKSTQEVIETLNDDGELMDFIDLYNEYLQVISELTGKNKVFKPITLVEYYNNYYTDIKQLTRESK